MEYSIFLFLLIFKLSTSVDFGIRIESGGYIWPVPDKWEENPKPRKFDLPNEESGRFRNGISNTGKPRLGIPDDGIPELGLLEQSIPELDTHNTYIILVVDLFYKFNCFYWIGVESSETKRTNAANSVAFMIMDELRRKKPDAVLIRFTREKQGKESNYFRELFRKPKQNRPPTLYRVAGSKGQFIMQIPLTYNELNGSDSFVLDEVTIVRVWIPFGANEHKQNRAIVLGKRILENDSNLKSDTTNLIVAIERIENMNKSTFRNFRKRFLDKIEGAPLENYFPQESTDYSDEELKNKINENLKLYEYFRTSEGVIEEEFSDRPPKLNQLKTESAYVLVDSHRGTTFIYLGHKAVTEVVQRTLSAAETFSLSMEVKNSWQQVKIIREERKLPTSFCINFSDCFFE